MKAKKSFVLRIILAVISFFSALNALDYVFLTLNSAELNTVAGYFPGVFTPVGETFTAAGKKIFPTEFSIKTEFIILAVFTVLVLYFVFIILFPYFKTARNVTLIALIPFYSYWFLIYAGLSILAVTEFKPTVGEYFTDYGKYLLQMFFFALFFVLSVMLIKAEKNEEEVKPKKKDVIIYSSVFAVALILLCISPIPTVFGFEGFTPTAAVKYFVDFAKNIF